MKTSTPSTIPARSSRATVGRLALPAKPNLLQRTGAGFLALMLMALAMFAATPVQAALIVKLPTATTDGSIENTEDITFTMTGSHEGEVVHLVLDEWVPSDGTQNIISVPASFPISINGGSDIVHASSLLRDNATGILADLTANDGFLGLGELTFVSGDTLTVRAGMIICPAQVITGFNPQANQTFTGSVFLMANLGTRISNIVTLPPARDFAATGGWVNGGNFTVGAVGTDWPAAESPDSAVDGDANTKFLIFRGSNAGLILTPNAGPAAFNRLALTTANDAPERDPASYIIYGSATALPTTGSIAISSLTQIATGTLALTNDRTTGPAIVQFNNTTPYASYVVVFPEVKNDPASTLTQIAEVQLSQGVTVPNQVQMGKVRGGQVKSGAGAFSDRFTFGTERGASDPEGNNWPAGESPDHALDGDASSKYLFFRVADNGILDTYFAALMVNPELGPAAVNSVSFWTANDAPERDPATYKIYASTTANTQTSGDITVSGFGISSWVQIATGALTLPAERGAGPTTITFPNTTPYASYLLVFNSVKNSPTTTLTQIAEVAFAYNPPNAAPSFTLTPTVPAGTLLFPRETNRNWRSITSSADGTKLAAVGSGTSIYTSSDSGVTWSAREIFRSRFYTSIASSADGTKLAATANNELIYTSSDSGVTWTGRASEQKWTSIASSDDGTKLVAVVSDDYIYTSSDSGVTWIRQTGSGKAFWTSVTSSGDGTKLVAGGTSGNLYVSADSGATWSAKPSSGSRNWRAIDSSEDGSTVVAVGQMSVANGPPPRDIFVSTDGGETWTQRGFTSLWSGITCSADGTRMAVCDDEAGIYTSEDSGTTWILSGGRFLQWNAITSSADGNRLAATVNGGQIYTSEAYANVNVAVGSGAFTAAGFATNISAGPASEIGQTVSFSLSADTASLFTTQPAIANDGTLTFTPGSTTGVATITVTATDNGGTAGGGVDTSAPRLFTISILPAVPTVASISPGSGSTLGNDSVTITGTDFTGATSVTIGGTAATNVNVVSATSITARTAAHAAGLVDVAVTTPSGTGTGEGLFTFVAPPAPETVSIGGTTVLSVPDFGEPRVVTNPLTAQTIITGTVNAASIRDTIAFTLPTGKVVTSGSMTVSNLVTPVQSKPAVTNSQSFSYTSIGATPFTSINPVFGFDNGVSDITAPTRCGGTEFSITLAAPFVSSGDIVFLPGPFGPMPFIENEVTDYGSASYVITLEIGDPETDSMLDGLTSTNSTFTPVFDSSTTTYSTTIPAGQTSVQFTPTLNSQLKYMTMKVNGDAAFELGNGSNINPSMATGLNTVIFRVCAQDGSETIYTVNITQAAANMDPTFSGYSFSTRTNTPADIAEAKILARASDADGGTPSIDSVDAASTGGGSVSYAGGVVQYTPPSSFTGADSFDVTIIDGQGGSVTGTIMVNIVENGGVGQNQAQLLMQPNGDVELLFMGIPGQPYQVQRSTDLQNWTSLGTFTAAADGSIPWTDDSPPSGSAFYRTAIPPVVE